MRYHVYFPCSFAWGFANQRHYVKDIVHGSVVRFMQALCIHSRIAMRTNV